MGREREKREGREKNGKGGRKMGREGEKREGKVTESNFKSKERDKNGN